MEDNRMMITDDNGNEIEVEIILTFEDEEKGKKYVLFSDPNDEDSVYAYTYDDDGQMDEVTDPDEWQMCAEVLGAFTMEDEDGEE